jgi:hypothetical protein
LKLITVAPYKKQNIFHFVMRKAKQGWEGGACVYSWTNVDLAAQLIVKWQIQSLILCRLVLLKYVLFCLKFLNIENWNCCQQR